MPPQLQKVGVSVFLSIRFNCRFRVFPIEILFEFLILWLFLSTWTEQGKDMWATVLSFIPVRGDTRFHSNCTVHYVYEALLFQHTFKVLDSSRCNPKSRCGYYLVYPCLTVLARTFSPLWVPFSWATIPTWVQCFFSLTLDMIWTMFSAGSSTV